MLGGRLGSNEPAPAAMNIFLVIHSIPSLEVTFQVVIPSMQSIASIASTLCDKCKSYLKGSICSTKASTCS